MNDGKFFTLALVLAFWGILELRHLRLRASGKAGAKIEDRRTLQTIFYVSVPTAIFAAATRFLPLPALPFENIIFALGVFCAPLGMIIREWSVLTLGKFFVVEVAVQAGQKVIESGPYLFVRHPSYSGALITMIGVGLMSGNWIGFVVAFFPGLFVLMRRIRLEEAVLSKELGEDYIKYMKRTKRLIPFVY